MYLTFQSAETLLVTLTYIYTFLLGGGSVMAIMTMYLTESDLHIIRSPFSFAPFFKFFVTLYRIFLYLFLMLLCIKRPITTPSGVVLLSKVRFIYSMRLL